MTGSTSGIGLGVAEALAARGSDVVLSGFGDATVIKDIVHSMETLVVAVWWWCGDGVVMV